MSKKRPVLSFVTMDFLNNPMFFKWFIIKWFIYAGTTHKGTHSSVL